MAAAITKGNRSQRPPTAFGLSWFSRHDVHHLDGWNGYECYLRLSRSALRPWVAAKISSPKSPSAQTYMDATKPLNTRLAGSKPGTEFLEASMKYSEPVDTSSAQSHQHFWGHLTINIVFSPFV